MDLLQNKSVQKYVSLFYYSYGFLSGWLNSDDKPHVFVCSVATGCWLPFLWIPSGAAAEETHQSQPVPASLRACLPPTFVFFPALHLSVFLPLPPLLLAQLFSLQNKYIEMTGAEGARFFTPVTPIALPSCSSSLARLSFCLSYNYLNCSRRSGYTSCKQSWTGWVVPNCLAAIKGDSKWRELFVWY